MPGQHPRGRLPPRCRAVLDRLRSSRPPQEDAPVKSRQFQSTVLIGIAIPIATVFISLVRSADYPAATAGIAKSISL
jgi:hypothetical protein